MLHWCMFSIGEIVLDFQSRSSMSAPAGSFKFPYYDGCTMNSEKEGTFSFLLQAKKLACNYVRARLLCTAAK